MTKQVSPRMLRMKDLVSYCALSRAYIYQAINKDSFPPGYMISPGIRAFEKFEVDAWLDQRMGKKA